MTDIYRLLEIAAELDEQFPGIFDRAIQGAKTPTPEEMNRLRRLMGG